MDGKPKPGETCPYCKINFFYEPWAAAGRPRVVCANCRSYHESQKSSEGDMVDVPDSAAVFYDARGCEVYRSDAWRMTRVTGGSQCSLFVPGTIPDAAVRASLHLSRQSGSYYLERCGSQWLTAKRPASA